MAQTNRKVVTTMRTLKFAASNPQVTCFDNNQISAFIPQRWANAGVALTVENWVAVNSVNQDFKAELQEFGDTVNTRQPATLQAYRKNVDDNVRRQSVIATNIPVKLNQHIHTTFIIKDIEASKAFQDLVKQYLIPGAQALARKADKIVLSQYAQFLQNSVGQLGGLSTSNGVQYIAEARGQLNKNKCPDDGNRRIIWGTDAETLLIQNPTFVQANTAGDGGVTQRTGYLGDKFRFHNYMAQNVPQLLADSSLGSGQINNGNVTKGSKILTVDNFAASEVVAGQWITINGKPYHVTATNNATATQLTLEYGLLANVVNDDAINVYDTANVTANYANEWSKGIVIDNGAGALPTTDLQIGQIVTFGTSNTRYVIIDLTFGATTVEIELDRPLEADLTASTVLNYGPGGGGFNLNFHRDCMTFVNRPLALAPGGLGAQCATATLGGVTMRITFTYDGDAQGTLVTLDMLCGIKVLDLNLGGVILS
jgi:hypothetical protein